MIYIEWFTYTAIGFIFATWLGLGIYDSAELNHFFNLCFAGCVAWILLESYLIERKNGKDK